MLVVVMALVLMSVVETVLVSLMKVIAMMMKWVVVKVEYNPLRLTHPLTMLLLVLLMVLMVGWRW